MQSDTTKTEIDKGLASQKGRHFCSSLAEHRVGRSTHYSGLCCTLVSDPKTHWGSFFGNAIADWSGVVVTVLATKYLYERGSTESRKPPKSLKASLWQKITDHSLTLFLVVTGLCWVGVYLHADPESKWGQVIGNVLSEWTQILALVLMTKHLIETHSKESH